MNIRQILQAVDHTLLRQDATWNQIKSICDEGIQYGVASVCIPASYVKQAADYTRGKIKICTVIGFPNGYSTTDVKSFEAIDAIKNGADEIDMVINVGWVKDGLYNQILREINTVKNACQDKILKVIIETCLLTDEEKIKLCEIVSESKADYIKTSTGFGGSGATKKDIELFAAHVKNNTRIKAAGGISSLEDAEEFLKLGANRLGTSRIIKIIKEREK